MKKLFLIALFIPSLSFGQKFEVAEQAGYGIGGINSTTGIYGFSNQLSFGYHFLKHFSVNAVYEFNTIYEWHGTVFPNNTSVGIAPDFTSKYFYAGIDLKMATFSTITSNADGNIPLGYPKADQITKTNASFSYGLHVGAKQKLYKRLSIIEQLGHDIFHVNQHISYTDPLYGGSSITRALSIFYLRAGLSYRF